MNTSFDEHQHARDAQGRFAQTGGSVPAVELTGDVDLSQHDGGPVPVASLVPTVGSRHDIPDAVHGNPGLTGVHLGCDPFERPYVQGWVEVGFGDVCPSGVDDPQRWAADREPALRNAYQQLNPAVGQACQFQHPLSQFRFDMDEGSVMVPVRQVLPDDADTSVVMGRLSEASAGIDDPSMSDRVTELVRVSDEQVAVTNAERDRLLTIPLDGESNRRWDASFRAFQENAFDVCEAYDAVAQGDSTAKAYTRHRLGSGTFTSGFPDVDRPLRRACGDPYRFRYSPDSKTFQIDSDEIRS